MFSWDNIVPRSFQFALRTLHEEMCKLDKCDEKNDQELRQQQQRVRAKKTCATLLDVFRYRNTLTARTPTCIQFHHFWYATYGRETCLTANVFAKKPLIHTTMCVCGSGCFLLHFYHKATTKRDLDFTLTNPSVWIALQNVQVESTRAYANGSTYTLPCKCKRARSQRVCIAHNMHSNYTISIANQCSTISHSRSLSLFLCRVMKCKYM